MSSRGADEAVRTILVADCGSSLTRVSLLARTEAGFAFVAHAEALTTLASPWSNVSLGVRHAIEQITEITGRPLLDTSGLLLIPESSGKGVDLFVATCSAGEPLRVVLAGLVDEISLASLERAAASSYTDVTGFIARNHVGLRNTHSSNGVRAQGGAAAPPESYPVLHPFSSASDEDKVAFIRGHQPDLIWVAGGTDGGSREPVRELVETLALACTLTDKLPQPAIVYAGNVELRSEIVDLVGEEVTVDVIDNVRPALNLENLAPARAAFQTAYVRHKVLDLPGIGDLIEWSSAPILPTAQALSYLVMYLERLYEPGKGVLCADVGSASTVVAASFPSRKPASEPRTAGDDESLEHVLQVLSNLGVGYGARNLLKRVGVDAIARWLPFEPEPGEIERVLLNKHVRSTTVPPDRRELFIEQAAAREALRLGVQGVRETWSAGAGPARRWLMPPLEPIIATGGVLTQAPRPGQSVLMLLDAVEPAGITTLVLDRYGLASALGAVALTQPLAAVQVLDAGAFYPLGTVVAPVGRARPGEVVMRVKIRFDHGGELEMEVKQGSLEMVPLRVGEKALLELRPRRGFSVGQVRGAVEVNGGAVGLVIDARGRPLRLPPDLEACHQLAQQWLWDMGA